ncbi:hypothetical protein C8Q75DRAFT_744203 [Abortiporus biennis]|nr:hypothetical protein C8Q75DRAFT_744203 [Abortiporus biennis]
MEKPLPDIPDVKSSTQSRNTVFALSVEGRAQFRKLIYHALEDDANTADGEIGHWVDAFESALRDMGQCIAMGGWLVGFRRARASRRKIVPKPTVECDSSSRKTGQSSEMPREKDEGKTSESGSSILRSSSSDDKGKQDDARPGSFFDALQNLREFVSRSTIPSPKPHAKHLLLTFCSNNAAPTFHSAEDAAYEFVQTAVAISFTSGTFQPPGEDLQESNILYGLDNWEPHDVTGSEPVPFQLVGGMFTLRGTTSSAQYDALTRVLRLAVFVYLSIILEQQFLSNSHVSLQFPKPSISPTMAPGGAIQRALSTGHRPKRDSGSGLWAFISKKKDDFIHRAANIAVAPQLVRRVSLELPVSVRAAAQRDHPPSAYARPRTSEEGTRPRRLSFISDFRPSFLQSHKEPEQPPPHSCEPVFSSALSLLKKYEDSLSTSPGMRLPPPTLLVTLAEREKTDPHRRLTGDEKAALTSLLGWEGKAEGARGMIGICGFVRQQSISLLYSEHVPTPISRPSTPAAVTPPRTASSSTSTLPPLPTDAPKYAHCGKRRSWITYRFYGQDTVADECLGEIVVGICERAGEPCSEPGCHFKRIEHELRWVHGGMRIVGTLDKLQVTDNGDKLLMWESCKVCGKKTTVEEVLDGTYLLSFAKYLELLIHSPAIFRLAKPPCEHTTLPPRPWTSSDTPYPRMRTNIVRNFQFKDAVISFATSIVEEIFEVRVPRLQIIRSVVRSLDSSDEEKAIAKSPAADSDKKALRREIMKWWQGLSDHIDELEDNFITEPTISYHKVLPRLPSADEQYDSFDEEGMVTPKGHPSSLPPLPPNTPQTPKIDSTHSSFPFPGLHGRKEEAAPSPQASTLSASSATTASTDISGIDSLHLLSSLRHAFQRAEQDLYVELARTPEASLNDVRRSFFSAAKGATKRLSAWETKHSAHLPEDGSASHGPIEPEWWQAGCHAVPGGNVIVRENDWGSIIAFTLSSLDYHRELASMVSPRPNSPATSPHTPSSSSGQRPSLFARTISSNWFSHSEPLPDPDEEGVVWHEPESCSAVITRKEHPRDPTSLLTLPMPDVLRPRPPDSNSTPPASKFGSLGSMSGKSIIHPPPPSAWAKPDVQISMQAADGHLSGASADALDKMLHELESVPIPHSRGESSTNSHMSSGFVEAKIRRGKASSIMSNDSTISASRIENDLYTPPPLPPKDPPSNSAPATVPTTPSVEYPQSDSTIKAVPPSSITSTLGAALRYMVKSNPPQVPPKHYHGLLSATFPSIDERPHIKYDWTIGKRLKFSCTVYYAKQFDSLRRRCGIEETFLRSLARSENWSAQGGKSRSNFWKTSDDQYIIKSLVNAWNVADLQVLIELGPSYFRYMDATANKPTVLAKLLGFYTVEIRNLETGTTQAKADLLIMENLFYNQKILKTFDLKGIQGRKVKAATRGNAVSKTLFDGEWIEGQQRALTLLRPHSKVVLDEAIKADCEYLAKSNIMDYSLLLGIDEERKQLACGLVDTIGSYTFAKTLEYKAKQGLNSGKEVTVVPPMEYQERFVTAMDSYFAACPDKWSRPLDHTKILCDYKQLPSVL